MSKKLADGIDALILDVKTGRGAFMQTHERSLELAKTLVRIGNGFGKETIGFITDMNQPLGVAIGNWLEVVESVECLKGKRGKLDLSSDLMELTQVLAGAMVYLGKKALSIQEGIALCKQTIEDGSAFKKFWELVEAQGGDVSFIENLEKYPISGFSLEVKAFDRGYIGEIDSLELGLASITLGAGRQRIDEAIDPKAGIILKKKAGDSVDTGDTIATLYTEREEILAQTRDRVSKAFKIVQTKRPRQPLILDVVDKNGVRKW
jgi:pyrimidine-nucleoside phosphorylase